MKHRPSLAALLALALLGSAAPPARADDATPLAGAAPARQPAQLFLDYERGPGAAECLAQSELVSSVEQRLGRRVFVAASAAEIQIRVRARYSRSGFVIDVELSDQALRSLGHRRLGTRGRHCSALDEALVLVVSLAADVSASPVHEAASALSVTPLETPIEIPASSFAPRLGWQARASLGVTALSGLLPALGAGLALEIELRTPAFWPIWLRAALWRRQQVGTGPSGAEFSAQTLELGVCPWTIELGKLESRSCAEQMLGRVQAQGFGFDLDQSGARPTWALGVTETLSVHSGDWFISVSGSLLAPLVQRRYFYVDGSEITLHDQAWVWGLGGIALGVEL